MYRSFFMVALSFLKSTQILRFPFLLSIITIGDNQVAFSTCYIVSIQPVPCLISKWYRCVQFNSMLSYFKWYALQVFISPRKDVFELLQQFNKLGTNKFKINVDLNLLYVFFRTQGILVNYSSLVIVQPTMQRF